MASMYWTQMNYTWVQLKRTKTPPSMYKIIVATADWVTGTLDACMHIWAAAAALHFLIVLGRHLTALRWVTPTSTCTILAAAPHPVLAGQYLSTQDRSLWIRSISWHILGLLISNMQLLNIQFVQGRDNRWLFIGCTQPVWRAILQHLYHQCTDAQQHASRPQVIPHFRSLLWTSIIVDV